MFESRKTAVNPHTGAGGKTYICWLLWKPGATYQEWTAPCVQLLCLQREQTGPLHQSMTTHRIKMSENTTEFVKGSEIQYMYLMGWTVVLFMYRLETQHRNHVVACRSQRNHGHTAVLTTMLSATLTSPSQHTLRLVWPELSLCMYCNSVSFAVIVLFAFPLLHSFP